MPRLYAYYMHSVKTYATFSFLQISLPSGCFEDVKRMGGRGTGRVGPYPARLKPSRILSSVFLYYAGQYLTQGPSCRLFFSAAASEAGGSGREGTAELLTDPIIDLVFISNRHSCLNCSYQSSGAFSLHCFSGSEFSDSHISEVEIYENDIPPPKKKKRRWKKI